MRSLLVPVLFGLFSQGAWAGGLESLFPGADELSPLVLSGSIQSYTPDTLWERINGEAELYRRFGVSEAAAVYYDDPVDPGRSVEVCLFRFSSPLGAFGLFGSFLAPGTRAEPVGNGGWSADQLSLFWHGEHLVLFHSLGADEVRRKDLEAARAAVLRRLGPAPGRPAALAAFEALVDPSTVRYVPDHLLGRDALPPGLEGVGRGGVRAFAAVGPVDAAAAVKAYGKVLEGAEGVRISGAEGLTGRDPNLGPVTVLARGTRLVGALGRPDAPGLTEALAALLGPERQ